MQTSSESLTFDSKAFELALYASSYEPLDQPKRLSLAYVESLFERLRKSGTPHVVRRDEPDVCALFGAHAVFSVAQDGRFPLLMGAMENLDSLDDWKQRVERIRRAAPGGVFGLWLFDDEKRELLVVSWGGTAATWSERSTGPGPTPSHDTLVSILLSGLPMPVIGANLADFMQTSDVGERFYRRIAKAVRRISKDWTAASILDEATRHELSLLLVSRLLFLHFIQEKDWLPDRDFIASLCRDDVQSVYRERLQPLFFDALNLPSDARISGVIPKALPYLNGGLFARSATEANHPTLNLSNRTIRGVLADAFSAFRFTDAETDTRRDAIAPQMLGEIFERLMHVEEKAQTGAFYTPKAICDEIVQQALWTTLEDRLSPRTLHRLQAQDVLNAGEAILAQRQLLRLRILDPSSGTGAFLLSAGALIEEVYCTSIAPALLSPMSRYELRRHLVTHSLSGIDIQPTAVLLTTLRLWLWVCAATKPEDDVTPLPNLEHRIRCGNALLSHLGVRLSPRQTQSAERLASALKAFGSLQGEARNAQLREIESLERAIVHEHLEAHHQLELEGDDQLSLWGNLPKRKRPTPDEIHRLIQSSSTMSRAGLFDPALHFADAMREGGFDMVVGNPPWLPLARVDEPLRGSLRAHYAVFRASGVRSASPDLSIAFMEACERLLSLDGTMAFLMPEKALRANWGRAWRGWMSSRLRGVRLRSYPADGSHGFRASVFPCAILGKKGAKQSVAESLRKMNAPAFETSGRLPKQDGSTPSAEHAEASKERWESWPPPALQSSPVLEEARETIGAAYSVRYGVKTAANIAYFDVANLDGAATLSAVRGRDIRPFATLRLTEMVFPYDLNSGAVLSTLPPPLASWAQKHERLLRSRKNLRANEPIWALQNLRADTMGWRVVWRDIATSIQAVVLPPVTCGGPIALNTTYGIPCSSENEAHLLCSWLNSPQASALAKEHAQLALNQHYRFDARTVSGLPLPSVFSAKEASSTRDSLIRISKALHIAPNDASLRSQFEVLAKAIYQAPPSHETARRIPSRCDKNP